MPEEFKVFVKIKALSVNNCWRGRRYKTVEYKEYEKLLFYSLPSMQIPEGDLRLSIMVGVSSKGSDIDNFLKPLLDILQMKYRFNDNRIYKLEIEKKTVKKTQEYITFQFKILT